jgi:hypothetical protein
MFKKIYIWYVEKRYGKTISKACEVFNGKIIS